MTASPPISHSTRFVALEQADFQRLEHAGYLKGLLQPFKGKGSLETWASQCAALRDDVIGLAQRRVLPQARAYPFSLLDVQLAQQTTGAGTTFMRWRRNDRSAMGVALWQELMASTSTPVNLLVDLHAITNPNAFDAATLAEKTYEMALANFAIGLDPDKVIFFVQSHVPEHQELSWVFTTLTPVGTAGRSALFSPKPILLAIVSLNRKGSCGTTLMWSRSTDSGMCRMSWPSITMRPDCGSYSRSSRLTSVDLPAPDGPRSTENSPWSNVNDVGFRAVNRPG